jgi:hypothetical protein
MAQRTNGSGGKPSDSKTLSREASGANIVIKFPRQKTIAVNRRAHLEQQLLDYLAALAGALMQEELTDADLETLNAQMHQFMHDTKRCTCP